MIKRPKRPRGPAQLAKPMIDIASGEVEDREPTPEEQGKDAAAAALGRKGGAAGPGQPGNGTGSNCPRRAVSADVQKYCP